MQLNNIIGNIIFNIEFDGTTYHVRKLFDDEMCLCGNFYLFATLIPQTITEVYGTARFASDTGQTVQQLRDRYGGHLQVFREVECDDSKLIDAIKQHYYG